MKAPDPDPAALLASAHALEPGQPLRERTAELDALGELLTSGVELPVIAQRDWRLELDAERAIDLARLLELDRARQLADRVLACAGDAAPIARARATEALGPDLAWTGTGSATREAEKTLSRAAELYAGLGETEWQGFVLFWLGHSVYFQNGNIVAAERNRGAALELLATESPRRATVLSFLADVLITRGAWVELEPVFEEAGRLAAGAPDPMSRACLAWARARAASARGDAPATERHIRETERDAGDWFEMHAGTTFLAESAEMLDRIGQHAAADTYLARAVERDPDDEFVRQARAVLLTRRGDPDVALAALQELTRGAWLEKRLMWRHTLLASYASLRAGRADAGDLAARALEQAISMGGVEVATSAEPAIVAALLPLAEQAGSRVARLLLAPGGGLVCGSSVAPASCVAPIPSRCASRSGCGVGTDAGRASARAGSRDGAGSFLPRRGTRHRPATTTATAQSVAQG